MLSRLVFSISFVGFLALVNTSCRPLSLANGVGSSTALVLPVGEKSINVSWTANIESDVNAAGGGYRIYAWTSPGVNTTISPFIDVPYDTTAGATPTTGTIPKIAAGTYYVRVVAYSAYNPAGFARGNRSLDSAETMVVVPQ